jgi:hypothetical protein
MTGGQSSPTIRSRVALRTEKLRRGPVVLQHRTVRPSEHGAPVLQSEPEPASLVHHPVVAPAQEHQVLKRGGSSVRPVDHVVGIAPGLRAVASREPAAAVPNHHRLVAWPGAPLSAFFVRRNNGTGAIPDERERHIAQRWLPGPARSNPT